MKITRSGTAQLILSCSLFAATSCTPTLSGVVVAENGKLTPTNEAKVNISSLDGSVSRVVVIDINEAGEWSTDEDLPPGRYLVEALVPGYGISSKKITLEDGGTIELRVKALKKIGTTVIGTNIDTDAGRGAGSATLTPPKL